MRVAPSVAWTHAQSRPCTDNAACGIVVVAWRRRRLLLRDMGTHQNVSEAGEGMRGVDGVMGRLAVQQCWRVVIGVKGRASVRCYCCAV